MTDDLVKRLRSANDESFVETLCGEAADHIEQLTAERDASNELGKALEEDSGQLREEVARLNAERDRLRDALESLHGFADGWRECGCGDSCYGRHAERNMVLDHLHDFARAALKGETP